jgi:hypothetical protein
MQITVKSLCVVALLAFVTHHASAQHFDWELVTPAAAFSPRDGAGAVSLNDKMWLLGGWNPPTNNEVWYSQNGITWTMAATAPWEPRHTAGYVVFQGEMWIVGGDANLGHYQNDVWRSPDGVNWTLVTDNVPWGPRVLHHTLVFGGRIWVMGGQTLPQFAPAPEAFYNDVWSSTDGVEWIRNIEHAPWEERGMIGGSVVFDDKMWILGGGTYNTPAHPTRTFYNDVWSSSDGVNWTEVLAEAPWEPRQYHDVAVFSGRMWVMEGYHGYNLNDVWYSKDGVNWQELEDTPWPVRHAGSVFIHRGDLWMVAGNQWDDLCRNDVWKLNRVATVETAIACVPAGGTVPFGVAMTVSLTNRSTDFSRRVAGRLNVNFAGGGAVSNWRSGYTNVSPLDTYVSNWTVVIPALGSVIGDNLFQLSAEDVTPAPWNQPPYPPAGDTATDACTVTGIAP